MGDAPRRYTATVGSGSYLPRIHLAELRRDAGELEQAIELLERCLREQPDFVGSVLPYASALLADGCEPGAVVRRLESLLAEISPAARFMLATALYEGGAASAGEAQFRIVLRQRPHSGRALVALGETLLAQRRYAEAAVEAAKLDIDDPLATAAARTGLFACIVVGDRPGAARALVRARGAGMGAAELDLFVAWSELASSGRTAIWPSSEALAPLEVMLEALLRVRELDAFEVLHGLLERCPLSERERHDMLAEMYLRRGFVAAAAEQWMAVCRHEPDVRALLGLARVAAAAGMSREAGEFAQAVLACDPDNELAAGLLPQGAGV
jgi:tetratricopeptide (TPR) repeat protein